MRRMKNSFSDELFDMYINVPLKYYKPHEIICMSIISVLIMKYVYVLMLYFRKHGVVNGVARIALKVAQNAPGASSIVAQENEKVLDMMKGMFEQEDDDSEVTRELPQRGLSHETLFSMLEKWATKERKLWRPSSSHTKERESDDVSGGVSGVVYHGDDKLGELITRVYTMFYLANPLHPDVFPYVRKMEAEVVRMTLSLFQANENACGTMTSGGTESIMNAMLVYREWGREHGIEHPEIVVPSSSHAAHRKAAHFFDIKMIIVPVDKRTFRADVRAMAKAITANTVALVGSAPQFPQGVIDPIEELGALAEAHNIGLHVDCCLGSFLVPCLRRLGHKLPAFDFSVPGVTSISADPHKFGYSPKGTSVVMYRHQALRAKQVFVETDWSGGVYMSPTMAGSRPGGLIAACWAVMMSMGINGYEECARSIMKATKVAREAIQSIDSLEVLGDPDASVIAFTSKNGDIYAVCEALSKKFHWQVNMCQFPRCAHICVTMSNCHKMDKFGEALRGAIQEISDNPNAYKNGAAAVYGMAESLPDREMVSTLVKELVNVLYDV